MILSPALWIWSAALASFNAETQRFAEMRRGFFFSALKIGCRFGCGSAVQWGQVHLHGYGLVRSPAQPAFGHVNEAEDAEADGRPFGGFGHGR